MALKTKLALSFLLMLLLTVVTAYMGWRAMEAIERQALMSSHVENSLTSTLLAQTDQLMYTQTKDSSYVPEAKKWLADSMKEIIVAQGMIWEEGRKKMASQVVEFLNWYGLAFEGLQGDINAAAAEENKLLGLNNAILDDFGSILSNIRETIMLDYTPAALEAFQAIYDAEVAFTQSRLLARTFVGSPSMEAARQTEDSLAAAMTKVEDARLQLRQEKNTKLTDEITKAMKGYVATFVTMRDKTLASHAKTLEIRERMSANLENMRALSRSAANSISDMRTTSAMQMFITAALALLLGIGVALGLSRNVQKQLGKDPGELAAIAARVTAGDFNVADNSPQIGVYGNIVNMVHTLEGHIDAAKTESARAQQESVKAREAMQSAEEAGRQASAKATAMIQAADKLSEVASVLSSASTQLASQIDESERGASEQAARMAETATAMDEMNATVLEVARNASSAAQVSAATRQQAEAGSQVVAKAVRGIQSVQAQALRLKEDMTHLDENAKAISQIMSVISDIADQTNLLALNAAIEAARAGEAGRGFAVVADEVRKLAEKTMASTADVSKAIKAIQDSAKKSMEQVDLSVHGIEEATEFSQQSGQALGEIVHMVDNTADQVRAIAAASEEQSSSSEEINQSINQVNAIAGDTARAMEEAAKAVAELAEQAQVLSRLITEMKHG